MPRTVATKCLDEGVVDRARARRSARPSSSSGRCCTSRRRRATRPRPSDRRRRRRRSDPCRRARAAGAPAAARSVAAMRCPVASRAGEEDAVERLREQGRADVARADDDLEHVVRNARRVQQPADVQAGQRRELRRLVEHRVAREQRRHEDVGADEIGIVPGRDVGDDARAGRGRSARRCAASLKTVSGAVVAPDLLEEEVDPRRARRPARCAPARSACRPRRSGFAPASRPRRRGRRESGRWRPCARRAASPPSPAGRARARPAWAATLAASSAGDLGDARAVGRVDDRRACVMTRARCAPRRGRRRAAAGRRACPRRGGGTRDATAPPP